MSKKKKPIDPRIVRALEKKEKAQIAAEKAWAKLKRAVEQMKKCERVVKQQGRQIARVREELAESED